LLKRRILAKSNDLLGKPLLHSIVFSDFSFVEQ
jgi:flagellar FliL protein